MNNDGLEKHCLFTTRSLSLSSLFIIVAEAIEVFDLFLHLGIRRPCDVILERSRHEISRVADDIRADSDVALFDVSHSYLQRFCHADFIDDKWQSALAK